MLKINTTLTAISTCPMDYHNPSVNDFTPEQALIVGKKYKVLTLGESGGEFEIKSEVSGNHWFSFTDIEYFQELRTLKIESLLKELMEFSVSEQSLYPTSSVNVLENGVVITVPKE